ncbi:uncharacterized protein [Triticum aestivum]|uniref:uncharacterized protein isoform X2 n=1 Tax=Triticum aestivum TaxID=4565 RepID=UPI001D017110|nr:uncharacterized protein LOC123104369 isoform X2 [Triticum aestivum]
MAAPCTTVSTLAPPLPRVRMPELLLSPARPSSLLCAAQEGLRSPLDQSHRELGVVALAGDLAVPSAPPSTSNLDEHVFVYVLSYFLHTRCLCVCPSQFQSQILKDAISGHGSTVAASSFTEDLLIPTEIRGYDYVIGDVRKGDQQGEDCMKNSCYQLGLDAPRKNTERRAEFRACSAPSMHQGKYIRGKGITCSAR